ncbi:Gfo/Idh/MocA family oxidoreductase [Rhizobium leguminosarum]|uniref:Gfo/Idh/MocA family oxidoreductase n=1 Tax=Rhizobium leguminosarum TaxID=384 RepID=UPI0021B11D47|nr:Gfo/Idh/MocA family oxidoreductase [Rhizobium leguminosarum]
MVLRIGVIGTGAIGRDNVRHINQVLAGARIVALSDVHRPSAEAVRSSIAPDAIVLDTIEELLDSPDG